MRYLLILIVFLAACGPKEESINKFSDDGLVRIYELQDQRNTAELLPLLKAKKESHRIAAALAFASIQDTTAIPYLNQMLQIGQDPMPRRAAAFALGQIGSSKSLGILKSAFDGELFNANRPYIMEAIGKCGDSSTLALFEKVEYTENSLIQGWAYGVFRLGLKGFRSKSLNDRMMKLLNDDNKDLAILASHYVYRDLRGNENNEFVDSLISVARYDEVKDRFSLLANGQDPEDIERSVFGRPWLVKYNTANDYERAQLIDELKREYTSAQLFLENTIKSDSTSAVIKNVAFSKYCAFYPLKKWDVILDALRSGDMALQSLAAIEIQTIHKPKYSSEEKLMINDLYEACINVKSQLKLSQQAETYIDICKAIEALGGEKFEGYQPKYNHPIDWAFVKSIPAEQKVLISTTQGNITLQLFVEDAPGTVSNFLRLVDSGFYDEKYFHRVVPQFVIQGGCPRGDGWGSLNWTQRSEFSNYQSYEAGTVGVASAGKDTEGVQFFITHCPTPHLDGRYSIFARVTEGMDVVNKISVGDKMLKVERIKSVSEESQ